MHLLYFLHFISDFQHQLAFTPEDCSYLMGVCVHDHVCTGVSIHDAIGTINHPPAILLPSLFLNGTAVVLSGTDLKHIKLVEPMVVTYFRCKPVSEVPPYSNYFKRGSHWMRWNISNSIVCNVVVQHLPHTNTDIYIARV